MRGQYGLGTVRNHNSIQTQRLGYVSRGRQESTSRPGPTRFWGYGRIWESPVAVSQGLEAVRKH